MNRNFGCGWALFGKGARFKVMVFMAGLAVVLMSLIGGTAKAQTWGEFFSQKKTQKKYLLEQIAALQLYIGYAKKGYELVDGGLGTIKDITHGEFSLHDTFISSLKAVSPLVRNNIKVAQIISYQIGMAKAFAEFRWEALLSAPDQLYILDVKAGIMAECGKDLESLLMVVSSGRLEMSESERIRRIDALYLSMQDKAAFTADFLLGVSRLVRDRERDGLDILIGRKLYGID
ncbi:hypothetical protein [Pedobacter miscanthi]|uniref:TerB family tellurite resistance protein n=1 Tax=Pedobacter miscanthi TaxID=2259170 RepID=A0A366KYV6_9SPHI|nr:hypothetical protein [Pedobacter miscanthi]RBQ06796.1 hypothetical protein DRW42_13580 [Pedobacter miscanthi]